VARNWRRGKPIALAYRRECTLHFHLCRLIAAADFLDQGDAVARHLLGATLQYRFPGEVGGGDERLGAGSRSPHRAFVIGDTSFHVATAPCDADVEGCRDDLAARLSVYLLVSDRTLTGTRDSVARLAKSHGTAGNIVVESAESFISIMVEWLCAFDGDAVAQAFTRIIDLYNQRVGTANMNPSLFIELKGAAA
jgi:hypothetical protein